LLAGLRVFQRGRIQLANGTDRFRAERADGAVAAGLQRCHALAFLAEQLPADIAQTDFGGATAIDGLEALQIDASRAAVNHEQTDPAAVPSITRGTRG